MRRPGPRHVAAALDGLAKAATPPTLLARVQSVWPQVVGEVMAVEAEPVLERQGTLTVACRSASWAQELALLAPDIVGRLNDVLAPSGGPPLRQLRVRTGRPPANPARPVPRRFT